MKRIVLSILTIYQHLLSPILKQILGVSAMCRYSPSCSEYTKHSIQKYGIIKGGVRGLQRLLTCHPYYKAKVKNQNSKV